MQVVNKQTEHWNIVIEQVNNHLEILVEGKHDHRSRRMFWRQNSDLAHWGDGDEE